MCVCDRERESGIVDHRRVEVHEEEHQAWFESTRIEDEEEEG